MKDAGGQKRKKKNGDGLQRLAMKTIEMRRYESANTTPKMAARTIHDFDGIPPWDQTREVTFQGI